MSPHQTTPPYLSRLSVYVSVCLCPSVCPSVFPCVCVCVCLTMCVFCVFDNMGGCVVSVLRYRVAICCCFLVILFCPCECRSHCCCSCHVGLKPMFRATQPKLGILCLHVLRQFHRLHFVYGTVINVTAINVVPVLTEVCVW